MAKSPHDFYLAVNGRTFDLDGCYGAQCWDGFAKYMQWLGYPVFHCTQSGYVKDIWNLRNSSGILGYCSAVQRPFQDGDIIVWEECPVCPLSHIAIFRKDNGNGTFVALGQNQGGGNGAFNQRNFTYDGVMGGFRPKCYVQNSSSEASVQKWVQDTTLKVGDKVKSVSCAIKAVNGSAISADKQSVYVPDLGGWVPLANVSEASDTKDGNLDQYLANANARIYLDECTVTQILSNTRVMTSFGYPVYTGPLMALR